MTAALEGGEWSAARPGRTLLPGKTQYSFYRRLGGPQGRSGRAENIVATGIRSGTVQPVASRYTDWATGPTSHERSSRNESKGRNVVRLCVYTEGTRDRAAKKDNEPKRDDVTGNGEDYTERSFMIRTGHRILFGISNQKEYDVRDMRQVWGRGEANVGFWLADQRERDLLEDLGVDEMRTIQWIFKNWDGGHELDWSGSR